jgi:hypothetical protein
MSRRTLRVLGLTLIVAMFSSALVGTADARTHHKLSKAQKKAISKKLMRAVKKNPRVVSKRWFLKQASVVDFALPATIRLIPARGQNPPLSNNLVSNNIFQNVASLDLGPSLGARTIGLGGKLHATVNFNDAFDGGNLGDVKLALPADSSSLRTTSVPLLTNHDVTTQPQSKNEVDLINLTTLANGSTYTISIGGGPGGVPSSAITTGLITKTGTQATDVSNAQAALNSAIGQYQTVVEDSGTSGVLKMIFSGAYGPGIDITPATLNTNEVQTLSLSNATGGTFTITVGANTTAALAYNAATAAVQSALEALASVGTGNVTVTGSPGNYTLTFSAALGNMPQATANTGGLTNTPSVVVGGADPIYSVTVSGNTTGGTFTLTVDGTDTTSALAYNESAANIQSALEALPSVGVGNVSVTGTGPYTVDFSPGSHALTANGAGLTSATPGSAAATTTQGSFALTEAQASTTTGGCSDFEDQVPVVNLPDVDGLNRLGTGFDAGNDNNLGAGPFSPEANAVAADTVLRTGALTLQIAGTGNGTVPPSGNVELPADNNTVATNKVGASGGRANLFGAPVNGLSAGNSVDVTVNLATKINSIARQVDGGYPSQTLVDDGNSPGNPTSANGLAERNGNVAAWFNCRQAWTGYIQNYLTGIHLTGSLKISPAITGDGRLRIAKVALSTPKPAKVAVAACLSPFALYSLGLAPIVPFPDVGFSPYGPSLPGGSDAAFDPHNSAFPAQAAPAPDSMVCDQNANSPLRRSPFNIQPIGSGSSSPTLLSLLQAGAAVGVSGDLKVTNLRAEVLVGSF